ncbi:MAG TPA: hypothetical protein VH253_00690 [Phycisphaerae bacterium]|nr:hypothetical protein [Phycisphaerae bacterium]
MKCHARSRGTALMMALVMMALVGAAVAALTVAFAADAHRTRMARITAQQRQLLLAATVMAGDELQAHGAAPRNLPLATPVAGSTLTLSIAPGQEGATTIVTARCMYGGSAGTETLTYRQNGGSWRLSDARLRLPP